MSKVLTSITSLNVKFSTPLFRSIEKYRSVGGVVSATMSEMGTGVAPVPLKLLPDVSLANPAEIVTAVQVDCFRETRSV